MKKTLHNLGVFITLGISAQAQAGWVAVPATGFASSAYTSCYNTGRVIPNGGITNNIKGNFGSYPIALAHYPADGVNDTCWLAKSISEASVPTGKTGFTATASATRPIPNPTGGAAIGEVYDKYWRNPTTNMCIIGTRIRMFNVDSDAAAGIQLFEVNDLVRSGFSGSGTVNVAYSIFATPVTTSTPVFRVGRTFTSVQHRAFKYDVLGNRAQNGTNYLDLPTKNSVSAATTGEVFGISATTAASTTLATQDAVVNANHVDFTLEIGFLSDDSISLPPGPNALSPFTYIEAPCAANPTEQAGAVSLRQTGQEYATQKVIDMTGYAIGATTP
ncbi:MAG: hypothetical protein ACO1N8_12340 [Methylophilus sp.]